MIKYQRRAILKGMGATLTLPWMPSLSFAADSGKRRFAPRSIENPPRRWATVIFGNGVHPEKWWAKGAGAEMQLSPTLEPLAPFREQLTILENFFVDKIAGMHGGNHTAFLAGVVPSMTKGDSRVAESIDRYMARTIGEQTTLPSLHLGVVPAQVSRGAYGYTMSWSSPTTPVFPLTVPARAFDRLFDVSGLKRNQSVLDVVGGFAKDLRPKLANQDKHKLDEYLTGVREIEQRIDRTMNQKRVGWAPSLDKPDMERPAEADFDVREHHRLMLDILFLAFQMDKTRIATLMLENDGTCPLNFTFLEGVATADLHGISHHGRRGPALEEYFLTNRYHVEIFAEFLRKMQAWDEGGSSLLDNSMIVFGSSLYDGDLHQKDRLPLLLAGRGGGTISGGRVIDRVGRADEERYVSNVHIACAQRMGCDIDTFGNGHMPVSELLGS